MTQFLSMVVATILFFVSLWQLGRVSNVIRDAIGNPIEVRDCVRNIGYKEIRTITLISEDTVELMDGDGYLSISPASGIVKVNCPKETK